MKYIILIIVGLLLLAGCAQVEEQPIKEELQPIDEVPTESLVIEEELPPTKQESTEMKEELPATWMTDLTCKEETLYFMWNNIKESTINAEDLKFHANGVEEQPTCEKTSLNPQESTACSLNTYVNSGRNNFILLIDEQGDKETGKVFCE